VVIDTYRKLSPNTLEFVLNTLEFDFNLLMLLDKFPLHDGAECSQRLLREIPCVKRDLICAKRDLIYVYFPHVI
jgi:hypothetical protein